MSDRVTKARARYTATLDAARRQEQTTALRGFRTGETFASHARAINRLREANNHNVDAAEAQRAEVREAFHRIATDVDRLDLRTLTMTGHADWTDTRLDRLVGILEAAGLLTPQQAAQLVTYQPDDEGGDEDTPTPWAMQPCSASQGIRAATGRARA